MSTRGRRRFTGLLLLVRPRAVLWGFVTGLVGLILIQFAPHAFYYFSSGTAAPARGISPFEYVPIIVGIVLVLGLPTGFDEWDRYGSRRVAVLSICLSAGAVLFATGVFAIGLALYPDDGDPARSELFPVASNVVIVTLLAVITIGPLGRLLGTLLVSALVWSNYQLQAQAHPVAEWLPLTWYYHADLTFDQNVRWGWLVALTAFALVVSWRGRHTRIALMVGR